VLKRKKREPLMPPTRCPVCGSEAIRSQGEQYEGDEHYCHMYCVTNDDHQWTETYTFTSYGVTEYD
jgi:hypothetical protein